MNKFIWFALGIIVGTILSIPISYCLINVEAYILRQLNLVEFATLLMTIIIAFGIPIYIQTHVDNKKVIKEIIVKDIEALIEIYYDNMSILMQLKQGALKLEDAQQKIRFVFHRGDLIVDGLTKQLNGIGISKDEILVTEITEAYYKYLTDGSLYDSKFVIKNDFIHSHEVQLKKVTTALKMVIQKVILR